MARMFAAVYGAESAQERLDAIEYLRTFHIDFLPKVYHQLCPALLGALNFRRAQELREMNNILRMHAQVGRPTFAQLRFIGMTVVTSTGRTAYRRPQTSNLKDPKGYFVTEIARRMTEEKELNEWNSYHLAGQRLGNSRVGATPEPIGLPAPPMTPAERRLAGKEAPKTPSVERI